MKFVKPITIDDSNFDSSSIDEPDSGETEWSEGTLTLGTVRILTSTHRKYEVVAASTTDNPTAGIIADPPTWIDIGPTNRWAIFDGTISLPSTGEDEIDVVVTPTDIVTSVSAFGISNVQTASVEVFDSIDGIVYTKEIELQDNSGVMDWWEFFFLPIVFRREFILLDLPGGYASATITVTFNGEDQIAVGELLFGQEIFIGDTLYGSSLGLMDFSRRERDQFGNFVINQRRTSKNISFDVAMLTSTINYVYNQIDDISGEQTTPVVWVASEDEDDPTVTYGFYRDFRINIAGKHISFCTIEVEGLI